MTMRRRFVLAVSPVVADDGSTALHLFSADSWTTTPADTPANTPVRGLLRNPGTLRRELFSGARVTGAITPSYGNVVLANPAPNAAGAGELDEWVDYGLAGADVTLYWGPVGGAFPADYATVYVAKCHSFVADSSDLTIRLRDQMQLLDQPFVTDGFAGTGGVEGTGAVASRKQGVLGEPALIEPILVDPVRLIYWVQSTSPGGYFDLWKGQPTAEVSPFDVYINGVKVSRSASNYASVDDMLANAPAAGYVRHYFGADSAVVSGHKTGPVYFRLVGSVAGDVRVVAQGYPTDADHAALGYPTGSFGAAHLALRAGVPLADIDLTQQALSVLGSLADDTRTYADILSDEAMAYSGWYGFSRLGRFRSGYLLDPASTSGYYGCTPGLLGTEPAADSVSLYTFTERQMLAPLRREPVAGMEAPVWSVAAVMGQTWPSQVAKGATDTLRDYSTRKAWASFSAVASGTKLRDPGAVHADVKVRARAITNDFGRRLWLERYLALYAGRRHFFSFTVPLSEDVLALDLHDCVTLQHRRFGCAAGVKARVVSITIDCAANVPSVRFVLWAGTPGRYTGGSSSSTPGGGGGGVAFVPPTLGLAALGDFTGFMFGTLSGAGGASGGSATILGDFTGAMVGEVAAPAIGAGGYAYSINVNDPVAVPAHGAGALLVMVARNGAGASPPSTPSGWTSVAAVTPSFGYGYRVMWRVDTDGSITSISPTAFGASQLGVHVYTGASAVGAVALQPEDVGSTATVPALTLDVTGGSSWVMCVLDGNQGRTVSDPTGLTARLDSSVGLVPTQKTWDSAGGVSGWSAQTSTWGGGVMYWTAVSLEIKA